jgi:hypothetical protein
MRIPMIAKIVQTAKQAVKAMVDIQRARPSAVDTVKTELSCLRIVCSRS